MGVSSRTLEITVISGENILVTEDPYVVVRAESLKCCTTNMAKDSGNNNSTFFSWNQKIMLNVPVHARSITFQVQSNRFKAVRPVGVARIAVSDFLNGVVSQNCFQVFSYRLRDWEGKRNGIIRFAVRVAPPEECLNSTVEAVKGTVASKESGDQFLGIGIDDKNSCNEVAVGVPIWWNYPSVV
ncbi:BON1-associated protein 2-like [Abrus precatorius]|uniref:BON1-associated protein 2-like n=1 Tax=Abrus precatorius TaxID=3816 RepID=A0A8B8K2P9_ABRPR|nr:BON1-associated protein 2-like [Abrus precatorius]